MLLWGKRSRKTKSLIMITMFKNSIWMWLSVWFGMVVWMLRVVYPKQSLIVIVMLKFFYLDVMLSLFVMFIFGFIVYTSLVMVSLPLFVCLVCLLYVRWSYNVCVIWEQMVMQMFLAQNRPRRGWNELRGFIIYLVDFNQILKTMKISFVL